MEAASEDDVARISRYFQKHDLEEFLVRFPAMKRRIFTGSFYKLHFQSRFANLAGSDVDGLGQDCTSRPPRFHAPVGVFVFDTFCC